MTKEKCHCFHCGDEIREKITFDEKEFCCQGCVSVYELLNASGLSGYYELNSSPGVKAEVAHFDYLENAAVVSDLLDFDSEELSRITLFIPSIHCSSCIWLLENLARILPGIQQSRVYFIKKELNVTFRKSDLTLRRLVTFLAELGYEPEINLGSKNTNKPKKIKNVLGLKIAVAGFCFGNSMFLSLPDYLDQNFLLDSDFKFYFGGLSVLLSLPVLFYSASDYFKSAIGGLRKRFVNIDVPIVFGILTLFVRSIFEIVQGTGTGYLDSLNGLVFFLLVGKWFQSKSYQALSFERDFKSFFPIAVEKVEEKSNRYIQVEEIKIGDVLIIHNDEILPADAVLLEGNARIDYSFVTGEAVAEQKEIGELLYAGGKHVGPAIRVQVSKNVSSSYLTSLWNQDVFESERNHSFKVSIDRISSYFTFAILAIAFGSAAYWYFHDEQMIWQVVSSILIVACPCALALSVPFAYGHTMRVLGRQQFYLKNAEIVEKLSEIKEIIFDKTGTLSSGKKNSAAFHGQELSEEAKRIIKSVASNSFHPYSRQIAQYFSEEKVISLDSFLEEKGQGISSSVAGKAVKIGSAAYCGAQPIEGVSASFVKIDDQILGYFTFEVGYREGIFEVLHNIKEKYTLHLLSGDNDREKSKLVSYFSTLHFNQKPEDKLTFIQSLDGEKSMMIGDGLNDAGALKQAHVGIAVAEDMHQFSPSCDAIVKGDRLVDISKYMEMSRYAMWVVYAAFGLSFLYNILGMTFAVSGNLTPLLSAILMPISSVSVVGFITLAISWKGKRLFG
jgi:P-type Cu+ transporter